MKANVYPFSTKLQSIYSTLLCASIINVIGPIPSTGEENTKGKITFGMGLFSAAASISLKSIKTEQTQPDLAVSRGDVSFDRVVVWGVDNIYPYLNKCDATHTSYAEWYFTLNSRTGGRPGDRILSIPLCKESLGPDYERKIAQLREFIVSKEKYQKPPFHP